jgi:signal peptidase I
VIVFQRPALAAVRCGAVGKFIKRIVGMPGDRWQERSGYVYINGKKLNEPYVKPDRRDTQTIAPITVPENSYDALGDNRSSSCDSREWGTVPRRMFLATSSRSSARSSIDWPAHLLGAVPRG